MGPRLARIAAAALLLAAAPSSAQQATPEQSLDCALWASYRMGLTQDASVQAGLSVATAYFIGLYEGQSGLPISTAMVERGKKLTVKDLEGLANSCIDRSNAYSARVNKAASEMNAEVK